MSKAVIYARYSCDNQREESIEGQLRECKAFAERKGYIVVNVYADRAVSAKTDNRPEFQKMVKDSAKKEFDIIIVWKLDRFSRSRYDSAKYKSILRKNNVSVVSATEAISEGAEGIILESVLEGMSEYYSADLSEKVTRGMVENVLKGKFNGGSVSALQKEQKQNKKELDNLLNAIKAGLFTKSTKTELERLENQQEVIEAEIAKEKINNSVVPAEQIEAWILSFAKIKLNTSEHKQKLIDFFVNSIFLYNDKFVIMLNFKGGEKVIRFDDLNAGIKKEHPIDECSSLLRCGDGNLIEDKKYIIQVGDNLGFVAYF